MEHREEAEIPESAKQYRNNHVYKTEIGKEKHLESMKQNDWFHKVENYYDAQDEVHVVAKKIVTKKRLRPTLLKLLKGK